MRLEEEIKQKAFATEHQKAIVNILYTAAWLGAKHSRLLKPFGLSSQQFNILRILRGQYPNPANITLLQERMLDKMSNASRLVDKLVQKELANRKECPNDRRQMDVLITDKGLDLLLKLDKLFPGVEEQTKKLSSEEAVQLNLLLDKMRD